MHLLFSISVFVKRIQLIFLLLINMTTNRRKRRRKQHSSFLGNADFCSARLFESISSSISSKLFTFWNSGRGKKLDQSWKSWLLPKIGKTLLARKPASENGRREKKFKNSLNLNRSIKRRRRRTKEQKIGVSWSQTLPTFSLSRFWPLKLDGRQWKIRIQPQVST